MLLELKLSAFKCFAELALPLRPLTLLAGVNGSGKSTVLQALVLLLQALTDSGAVGAQRVDLPLNGSLLTFGWAKLLLWLRKPRVRTMRVPLMGVRKELQSSRLASQLAFMMIEAIRKASVDHYGASRGEIGWVLDDNQGMNSIATAIESKVNKVYQVYERTL